MVEYFFFQAEDDIRGAQESRGLGDVYKRQPLRTPDSCQQRTDLHHRPGQTLLRTTHLRRLPTARSQPTEHHRTPRPAIRGCSRSPKFPSVAR